MVSYHTLRTMHDGVKQYGGAFIKLLSFANSD